MTATKDQLSQPLKQDTDYFDATEAIKAIEEELRLASNRMVQLERLFQLQSDINGRLLENMNQLLVRVAAFEDERSETKSSLILPDHMTN